MRNSILQTNHHEPKHEDIAALACLIWEREKDVLMVATRSIGSKPRYNCGHEVGGAKEQSNRGQQTTQSLQSLGNESNHRKLASWITFQNHENQSRKQ